MTTFSAGRPFARITRVETHMLRLPLERPIVGPFGRLDARPNLLVRMVLDSGIEGIGEIWANFPPWGCQERIEIVRNVLAPLLVGEEAGRSAPPLCTDASRLRLLANQWGAPGPVHQAVAGLDIAIWDAHARTLGLSLVHALRGERTGPGSGAGLRKWHRPALCCPDDRSRQAARSFPIQSSLVLRSAAVTRRRRPRRGASREATPSWPMQTRR